jgi:ankyrin repeat protein
MKIIKKLVRYITALLVALFVVFFCDKLYHLHCLDIPVNEAADRGDLKAVRGYVSRGADLEFSQDDDGYTALVLAILNKHDDVAIYLIEHNANVKITTNDASTPLSLARKGSKVYQMILERGGDKPIPNSQWHDL